MYRGSEHMSNAEADELESQTRKRRINRKLKACG